MLSTRWPSAARARAPGRRCVPGVEAVEGRVLPSGAVAAAVADDFGDTFAEARPIALDRDGSGSQPGSIEVEGDVDVFSFVAPVTGTMTIRHDTLRGTLDGKLSVFDQPG